MTDKKEILEKACEKRHEAAIKWRKEKAGSNIFKKWFYLGKKHKITDEFGYKYEYDAEKYYSAPYDKTIWKRFKKYCKKLEIKGVIIHRPWLGDDKFVRCRIYKSRRLFESPFRKFSSYWWKDTLEDISDTLTLKHNFKTCSFDFFDIYENLIVNLTIKGLYFGLHGIFTKAKEQMHWCWTIRDKLLKAYCQEEWASYNATKSCEEVYGVAYSPEFELTDNTIKITNSPSKEVEDYYNEQYMKCISDASISKEAFEALAEHINDLWD